MTTISSIALSGVKGEKQRARELVGVKYDPTTREGVFSSLLEQLSMVTVGQLDRKVKHGENLTFDESFLGTCTVLAATNARFYAAYEHRFAAAYGTFSKDKALALAAAYLNLMATKESLKYLTPEEIAGMAAATSMDLVLTVHLSSVVETCGMGGDRGFVRNGERLKTINASTLSALVLSGLGLSVAKHGSYGNTSAVGSTEAIESFGANTSMRSIDEVRRIIGESNFCFFDAHWCKTIHDLSHLLMMETVNHVIGPMTPPISSSSVLSKSMGVNEKVHPEAVAKAYGILNSTEQYTMGGVVIVAGLDSAWSDSHSALDYGAVREHVILDEVSPFASVVAVGYGSEYRGCGVITPADFGVEIDPGSVWVENQADLILRANMDALQGTNAAYTSYLAMNAALGLFAAEYARHPDSFLHGTINARYLQECYQRCHDCIISGAARAALEKYISASQHSHAYA